MSKETVDANKLIAFFMGAKEIEPLGHTKRNIQFPEVTHGLVVHHENDLCYHSSWGWLMEVVERIWRMNKMVSINYYTDGGIVNSKIYNWELGAPYQEAESTSPIQAVYVSVLDFINFYNQTYKQ